MADDEEVIKMPPGVAAPEDLRKNFNFSLVVKTCVPRRRAPCVWRPASLTPSPLGTATTGF